MPTDVRRTGSAFRAIVTRLRGRWAGPGRATVQDAGPEAARIQAALDMHELGVRLYRQRMHREHPDAHRGEIDGMVLAWLAEPPHSGQPAPAGEGTGTVASAESALRTSVADLT